MVSSPTVNNVDVKVIEARFLKAVKLHLAGWKAKIENDFREVNYATELASLQGDPVYSKFALDCPEYVLVRLIGRMSISVGRRLGEMYDKLPRYLASARFNVPAEQVAEKFDGLELDIGLRFSALAPSDCTHLKSVLGRFGGMPKSTAGAGIEIRYNFNPNDSSRLRKDVEMAELLIAAKLVPIYLIYSAISPRDEAIARLKRAGWHFLQGDEASGFTKDLFSVDFLGLLDKKEIREEIHQDVREIMCTIFTSPAAKKLLSATPIALT